MKKYYKEHIKISHKRRRSRKPETVIACAVRRKFSDAPGPLLIAVGGPGGTGKTTFAARLARELRDASVLALDDYKTARSERAVKNIFGPHPQANRMKLLAGHLAEIKRGMAIEKPVYCRRKGAARTGEVFSPRRYVIMDGEVATYRDFHRQVNFSVFIDAHGKTQLNTRISRDIDERGYTPKKAIAAFFSTATCTSLPPTAPKVSIGRMSIFTVTKTIPCLLTQCVQKARLL